MRAFIQGILACGLLSITAGNINAQNITVSWAGNSSAGYNGSGMPGYQTMMSSPMDVCIDAAHNLYYVDQGNGIVRKVSAANGVVSTIAGGGTSSLDGVLATDEALGSLSYMCIDGAANIFISVGNQVKKIDAFTGVITTVTGSGTAGYTGDGFAATDATVNTPQGICIDASGNIYFVDQGNNVIRKITASTGIITTIAGTGVSGYSGDGFPATAATLSNPIALAVNKTTGDLFFSDQGPIGLGGQYIRKIDGSTGIISTIAGTGAGYANGNGGLAANASVGWVYGICCDDSGDVIIDDVSCACRKINMTTGIINTLVGSDVIDGYNGDGFNSLLTLLNWPHGVCVDHENNIYIADSYNSRFRKAIHLTNVPSFAYGKGQSINPCSGDAFAINMQMAVADLDSAQAETWTVVSAPVHGTLAGFPYTALSFGQSKLVTPTGMSYTAASSYTGNDSFKVMVSDGTQSETVTMYVSASSFGFSAGTISGPSYVAIGSTIELTSSVPNGVWSIDNPNASLSVGGQVTGMTEGTATVIYTYPMGCAATTSTVITIGGSPTAVNGFANGVRNITVMPNPATDKFNVTVSSPVNEQVTVIITNVAGEVVKEMTGDTNKPINVSLNAPAGIYMLNASTTHGKMSSKMVIQ